VHQLVVEKRRKKKMKKLLTLLFTFSFISVFVVACGQSAAASPPSSSSGNVAVVHMGMQSFLQSSVTIKKGESLKLVNGATDTHLIRLGQWINGTPTPETEPGAPHVQSLEFNGQVSHVIGPWNTPGTYHLYCTIHRNMQLTVVVQ
jgi:plastocyanin